MIFTIIIIMVFVMVLTIFMYTTSSFKDIYDNNDIDYDQQAKKRRLVKMKKLNKDISTWIKQKKKYLDSI